MKVLADLNVEAPVVAALREAGHDVVVPPLGRERDSDSAVLRRAESEDRILVTNDKDFAELAFLQRTATVGIVLVRMPRSSSREKARRVVQALETAGPKVRGCLTVVEAHALRHRRLPRLPHRET
jgi:predicted nuclease of predicted toxin-antitoxin system